MNYNLSHNDQGEGEVTFVQDGVIVTIQSSHPNYKLVVNCLLSETDPTAYLSVKRAVESLGVRVSVVDNDTVLFDGEEVDNRITRTILRYRAEGRDTAGIVSFLERLSLNPSKRARTELFDWVENQQLTIDAEGYFIAHKGVNVVDDADCEFDSDLLNEAGWYDQAGPEDVLLTSVSSGTAMVNGVVFTGRIPNWIGATVTMPRTDVDDDHGQDCSEGLHIGSFRYARGFASRLIEVRVDPADVVTVPRYDTNKLRCAKYTVVALQAAPEPVLTHWEPEETLFPDEDFLANLEAANVPQSFIQKLWARLSSPGEE